MKRERRALTAAERRLIASKRPGVRRSQLPEVSYTLGSPGPTGEAYPPDRGEAEDEERKEAA